MADADSTDVLTGIGFMVLGVSLLPAMNTFAKTLAAEFPVWQVVWARFLGHLLWMSIFFWPKRGLLMYGSAQFKGQCARSFTFFISNVCFISALTLVPLATASAIMFTTPLVVTALCAPLLGERIGVWRWSAVVAGFCGALIIIRPGTDVFNAGAVLVLISAFCFGFYQILTRKLARVDGADTQIVYGALAGAIITTLTVPWIWHAPESAYHWFAFAAIGLFGGSAQLCIIKALQHGPASVISPIGYAEIVSAVIFGYVVFGDFPDVPTWYGAALIIASGLFITYRERVRSRST